MKHSGMGSDLCREACFKWIETRNSNDLLGYEALYKTWQAAWQQSRTPDPLIAESIDGYPDYCAACGEAYKAGGWPKVKSAAQYKMMEELRTALKVVTEVMEIASDWNAPMAYDIEAPEGWEEIIDPDGDEPTWPTLYGIINKCKTLLAKLPAAGEL